MKSKFLLLLFLGFAGILSAQSIDVTVCVDVTCSRQLPIREMTAGYSNPFEVRVSGDYMEFATILWDGTEVSSHLVGSSERRFTVAPAMVATTLFPNGGTVRVTADIGGGQSSKNIKINPPPAIPDQELPDAFAGEPYSFQLQHTGGTRPFTWSANSVAGLTVSPTGTLLGAAGTPGDYMVNVEVADTLGVTAMASLPFSVDQLVNPLTDDAVGVLENESVLIDFSANDCQDCGLFPSSVVIADAPGDGTVVVAGNQLRYAPHGADPAEDVFTYRVRNAQGALLGPATVTVTRIPVAGPIIAREDLFSVVRGPLWFQLQDLMANDQYPAGTTIRRGGWSDFVDLTETEDGQVVLDFGVSPGGIELPYYLDAPDGSSVQGTARVEFAADRDEAFAAGRPGIAGSYTNCAAMPSTRTHDMDPPFSETTEFELFVLGEPAQGSHSIRFADRSIDWFQTTTGQLVSGQASYSRTVDRKDFEIFGRASIQGRPVECSADVAYVPTQYLMSDGGEDEEPDRERRRREFDGSLDFCFRSYEFFDGDLDLLVDCLDFTLATYTDTATGSEILWLCLFVFFGNLQVGNGILPIGNLLPSDLDALPVLDDLRIYRDQILAGTEAGRRYIELYYRHSPEVIAILMTNPELLAQAKDLFDRQSEWAAKLASGNRAPIESETLDEIREIIRAVGRHASKPLRQEIAGLMRDLNDEDALARFAVEETKSLRQSRVTVDVPARMPIAFEASSDGSFSATGLNYRLAANSRQTSLTAAGESVEFTFAGAQDVAGYGQQPAGAAHYFVGSDPAGWRLNRSRFRRVQFDGVYPGIDLIYYGVGTSLEYDFVLAADTDPSAIQIEIEGAQARRIDAAGDLVLDTPAGEVRLQRPVAFQTLAGKREPVEVVYRELESGRLAFALGEYDHSRPLTIDPILSYSGPVGGSLPTVGTSVAVDASGNIYVGGVTLADDLSGSGGVGLPFPADDFPIHAFVTKLDPTGEQVLYTAYIGGDKADFVLGLDTDAAGNVYGTGGTSSNNFPVVGGVQAQSARGSLLGTDAFVFKLAAAGNELLYSTYLGGSGDDAARGIAVDAAGNAIIAGVTTSNDLPTVAALQGAAGRGHMFGSDAFAAKLNAAGDTLVYSTYLGGERDDMGMAVAVDASGSAYVTGMTWSEDFPIRPGAALGANAGDADAFVVKIPPEGGEATYATYLGGESQDFGLGIAVDDFGSAFVTGSTHSREGIATQNGAQPHLNRLSGFGSDAFVVKMIADGSQVAYGTYWGENGNDSGYAIQLDSGGNAWIAGQTQADTFPLVEPLQFVRGATSEGIIVQVSADGSAVAFSTWVGGKSYDMYGALAIGPDGRRHAVGFTGSSDIPSSYGAALPAVIGDTGIASGIDLFLTSVGEGDAAPFNTVNSATLRDAEAAPNSLASGFGIGLAEEFVVAPGADWPTVLGGLSVNVRDSQGVSRAGAISAATPGQINYVVPAESAPGLAQVTVDRGGQVIAEGHLHIVPIAPGVFTANSSGRGVAAAIALRVAADGEHSTEFIFETGQPAGRRLATPIAENGSSEQLILLLFGTGIRGATEVTATVGGVDAQVLGFAAQSQYPGLDQVNVAVPVDLPTGEAFVLLTVDGIAANPVTVYIE